MILTNDQQKYVVKLNQQILAEFYSIESAQMYIDGMNENDRKVARVEIFAPNNKQILLG